MPVRANPTTIPATTKAAEMMNNGFLFTTSSYFLCGIVGGLSKRL
jgi:hypothetical protein